MGLFDFMTGKKPKAANSANTVSPWEAPLALERNNAVGKRAEAIVQDLINQGYDLKTIRRHAIALARRNLVLAEAIQDKVYEMTGNNASYQGGKRTRRNRKGSRKANRKGSRSAHRKTRNNRKGSRSANRKAY